MEVTNQEPHLEMTTYPNWPSQFHFQEGSHRRLSKDQDLKDRQDLRLLPQEVGKINDPCHIKAEDIENIHYLYSLFLWLCSSYSFVFRFNVYFSSNFIYHENDRRSVSRVFDLWLKGFRFEFGIRRSMWDCSHSFCSICCYFFLDEKQNQISRLDRLTFFFIILWGKYCCMHTCFCTRS